MAQSAADCPIFNKASDVPAYLHDPHHDSKRPIFHVMAARGWASDPCGPVYYKGRYHMFYQHQRQSCQWFWGLCWDHVVSDDLVHWKNLPPAVIPTPGWYDADGCFSGTVEVDPELGVPVIMYTGVYLKGNTEAVAAHGIPPPEHDPGTRFVERQLAAVPADPDDPDLTIWIKLPTPVMEVAPAGLNISCWRDPFCIQRPAAAGGEGDYWVVLLASGIRGKGGAVLRFKSKHWTYGWQFDGLLADGDNHALGIKGQDWECPILAKLPDLPAAAASDAAASDVAASDAAAAAAAAAEHSPYVTALDGSSSNGSSMIEQILQKGDSNSSSKPLLPKLDKFDRKRLGICGSSCTGSSQSLLGVGHYPAAVAGSSSSSDLISLTGSSSSIAGYRAAAMGDTLSVSGASVISCSSSGSSSSLVKAANPSSSSSSSESLVSTTVSAFSSPRSSKAAPSPVAAAPASNSAAPAAAAAVTVTDVVGNNIVITTDSAQSAPLTEPVLAAATSAAAAVGSSADDDAHPAVNLYAWLEQTDPTAATAAAAAAAAADPSHLAAAIAAAAVPPLSPAAESTISGSGSDLQSVATGLAYQKFASTNIGSSSSSSLIDVAAAAAAISSGDVGISSSSTALATPVAADDDLVVVVDSAEEDVGVLKNLAPAAAAAVAPVKTPGKKNWWFCMSPDACNNPITWWLGDYDGQRFDLQHADGPHRLDLGTTLYAASLWQDTQGRQLLYGWIQEHRRVPRPPNCCGDFVYAGCICTPRVLHLHNGHLYQTPLPEIDMLRTKVSWHSQDLLLDPTTPPQPLQVVSGTHLDINITLQPPATPMFDQSNSSQTSVKHSLTKSLTDSWVNKKLTPQPLDPLDPNNPRAGLIFKSWRSDGQGAAVLSFNWSNFELAVDFDAPFPDAYNPHPEDTPERRRIGGKLVNYVPGTELSLRVLVDGSAVEIFTSTGETFTTRIYRGHPPKCPCQACCSSQQQQQQQDLAAADPAAAADSADHVQDETGIALFAANAAVLVSKIDVYEMGSCWAGVSPLLLEQLQQQQAAVVLSAAAVADMNDQEVLMMMQQRAAASKTSGSSGDRSEVSIAGDLESKVVADLAAAAAAAAVDDQVEHVPAGIEARAESGFLRELHINPVQA